MKLLFCFILVQSSEWTQAQDEEKPQYAPHSEKRRNVTDEFGQKQKPLQQRKYPVKYR